MKIGKILDKMADIIKKEEAEHESSITSNHVFLISKKTYRQIEKYYNLDMTEIRVLRFGDYTLLRFDGVVDEFILFGEIYIL